MNELNENELIFLERSNIRKNFNSSMDNDELDILNSFKNISEKFENQEKWLKLIGVLRNKSYFDRYNYIALIEQSGILNMDLETQREGWNMSSLALEYLTGWIHKFKAGAFEEVADLIAKYHKPNFVDLKKVPSEYLKENVHKYNNGRQIGLIANNVINVGEYFNHGVVIPKNFGYIVFNKIYNCAPVISLIKGDKEFISFLHVWASEKNTKKADKQVKHWMEEISKVGEVTETIFAPRNLDEFVDTKYAKAPDYIKAHSKKAIIYSRDISEIEGIANKNGVYFQKGGYHLWGS
ncbi:MAG: hypothetical protein ACP5N2_07170 [Candidatus Nanoarchaeia archaeon]